NPLQQRQYDPQCSADRFGPRRDAVLDRRGRTLAHPADRADRGSGPRPNVAGDPRGHARSPARAPGRRPAGRVVPALSPSAAARGRWLDSSLPEMLPAFRLDLGGRYPDILQDRGIDARQLRPLPGPIDPGENQIEGVNQPPLPLHRGRHLRPRGSVVETEIAPPIGVQRSWVQKGDAVAARTAPQARDSDQREPQATPQAIPKTGHPNLHLAKADDLVYDLQKCMRMGNIIYASFKYEC